MDDLLAAEEQLELAWCVLDAEWHRLLDEASEEAARLVDDARAAAADEAARIVDDARAAAADEAARIVDDARAAAADEAGRIVDDAHAEAAALLLEAQERADRIVAEARTARPEPAVDDPTGIREALQRLRSELSHVVDAALDAFPAIEATAELFAAPEPVIDLTADDPVVDVGTERHERPGRLRRLLRLAR